MNAVPLWVILRCCAQEEDKEKKVTLVFLVPLRVMSLLNFVNWCRAAAADAGALPFLDLSALPWLAGAGYAGGMVLAAGVVSFRLVGEASHPAFRRWIRNNKTVSYAACVCSA